MENSRFKFRVWDKQNECYAYSNNSDVDLLYIETDGNLTYGVYSNDYEDMILDSDFDSDSDDSIDNFNSLWE